NQCGPAEEKHGILLEVMRGLKEAGIEAEQDPGHQPGHRTRNDPGGEGHRGNRACGEGSREHPSEDRHVLETVRAGQPDLPDSGDAVEQQEWMVKVPYTGDDLDSLAFLVPVIPERKRDVAGRQPKVEDEQKTRAEQCLNGSLVPARDTIEASEYRV